MQHLYETLRELKRLAPGSEYAASSRAEILASPRQALLPRFAFVSLLRGAGAFAMAGLAVVGSISLVRSMMPASQVSSDPLNQHALSAEAETIATQLALADLQYNAITEDEEIDSVNATALAVAKSAAGNTSNVAVDRALLALSD